MALIRITANPDVMRKLVAIGIFMLYVPVLYAQHNDYLMQAIPFTSVGPQDKFWLPQVKEISPLAAGTVKSPIHLNSYYAWAHRGNGEMQVGFPEKINAIDIISK